MSVSIDISRTRYVLPLTNHDPFHYDNIFLAQELCASPFKSVCLCNIPNKPLLFFSFLLKSRFTLSQDYRPKDGVSNLRFSGVSLTPPVRGGGCLPDLKRSEVGQEGPASTRNTSLLVSPFPSEVGPGRQTKIRTSVGPKGVPGNRQTTGIVMTVCFLSLECSS